MAESKKIQIGINNISNEWFRANIDRKKLKELKKDLSVEICSNPEFLKEGSAVEDFTRPDRIIIGADNKNIRKIFDNIYKPFTYYHCYLHPSWCHIQTI